MSVHPEFSTQESHRETFLERAAALSLRRYDGHTEEFPAIPAFVQLPEE
jgi:hypothetical protein